MRRLERKEKERIIKMINNDKSLTLISKATGRSKTTIYYHMRKIKGKQLNDVMVKKNNLENLGEFLGVFAGDGFYNLDKKAYHHFIRLFFNVKETKYVDELEEILVEMFGKKPYRYKSKTSNMITLRYYSKNISKLIFEYISWKMNTGNNCKSKTVYLKKIHNSDEFKIGFLRGSLDSDGYLAKNKMSFATVSPKLARNICNFLDSLKFSFVHKVRIDKRENKSPIHIIYLNKPERERFMEIVKPRNRSNL